MICTWLGVKAGVEGRFGMREMELASILTPASEDT